MPVSEVETKEMQVEPVVEIHYDEPLVTVEGEFAKAESLSCLFVGDFSLRISLDRGVFAVLLSLLG